MSDLKLSEAIRLGAMLKPQSRTNMIDRDGGTCALGSALDAIGELPSYETWSGMPSTAACEVLVNALWRAWPMLRSTVTHPLDGMEWSVGAIVPSLNDDYRWTREAIADWVETIEAQQAQPVTEVAHVAVV